MWQGIGASVVGSSHLKTKQPCQDYYSFRIEGDLCYCGIADGLGSASHADIGARIAVESGLDALKTIISTSNKLSSQQWAEYAATAFSRARKAVLEEADKQQVAARELATTLLLAILSPQAFASCHIGDGAAVVQCGVGIITASPPDRLEFANETTPLTSERFASALRTQFLAEPVTAVALLTDGLQNLAINSRDNAPFLPFFEPFFTGISAIEDGSLATRQLEQFLSSKRVLDRTDDDKTLVIIGRKRVDAAV
jgi:Protein phosphatase 2C